MTYNLPYAENISWTPVVTGGSAAGTGTYTTQAGRYTRIGNMLFLQGVIVWSAHTGTGDMTITGLPFPCRNQTNYNPEGICNAISIPLPGSALTVRTTIQPNSSTLALSAMVANNSNSPVQMNNTGTLHITISYLI